MTRNQYEILCRAIAARQGLAAKSYSEMRYAAQKGLKRWYLYHENRAVYHSKIARKQMGELTNGRS
jgi:hypothetical protein